VATRVYLVRHGITDWNMAGRLAGRLPGISLNARGRRDAEALAARLASEPLGAVVASPLERAQETAALIAGRHGLPVLTDRAFVERAYPQWQGMLFAEIRTRFGPEIRRAHDLSAFGVETWDAMGDRMFQGLERLGAAYPGQAVAIISHADPLRALIGRIIGMPVTHLRAVTVGTSSLSRVRRRNAPDCARVTAAAAGIPRADNRGQGAFVVDYFNSRTHLADPPPPSAVARMR